MALDADDAKVYKRITRYDHSLSLQSELENIYQLSLLWRMDFNLNKCLVISYSRKRNNVHFYYNTNGGVLRHEDCIRDLGLSVESDLSWDTHIRNSVNKAFNVLWFLKWTLGKSPLALVKKDFLLFFG